MSILAGAFAALALVGAHPEPQDPPASTQLEDVIVEGRRLQEQAESFIAEVGAPPPGTRPARWNRNLCVSVTNLRPDFAQYLIDRIAIAAIDAGADMDGEGCRPNVMIFATNDGSALARQLVDGAGIGFRPSGPGNSDLGRRALANFQSSTAPVKWWHVTLPVLIDTDEVVLRQPGEYRTVNVREGSRLRSNIRYDLGWVVIVLDMSQMQGAPFGAVSDYVAMVTLTQADPAADMTGHDSIMNLFARPGGVDRLTEWDQDYLKALYETPPNRFTAEQQTNMMVRRLAAERRSGQEEPEAPTAPVGN